MAVYIFVTPGMAVEKTTYILANSENEAIIFYCNKYNKTIEYAKKLLEKKIEKSGIFYEHLD